MITDPRLSSLSPTMETHPSDSTAQRKVELAMLQRLGEQHPEWQRSDWKVTATRTRAARRLEGNTTRRRVEDNRSHIGTRGNHRC